MVNYADQPALPQQMQRMCVVFLYLCLELCKIQLSHGGHMFLENPGGSTLFNHRVVKNILKLLINCMGRERRVVLRHMDMCRFGKTDSQGRLIRKRLGLLVDEELGAYFTLKCQCQ